MSEAISRIKDWPEHERPRERLMKYGAESLSEAELLGIILRVGNPKESAMELARRLLIEYGGLRGIDQSQIGELCRTKGVGLAKAAQIKAALELAKRLVQQKWDGKAVLNSAEAVYQYIHLRMRDLKREEFHVLFLTARNELIDEKTLFEGSLMESVVSPREIIRTAVQLAAASVILLHNHPSGNPSPSEEDRRATEKISKACRYADISVLDHIIIGKDSFFSFADHGLLPR
ncbi:MAG: DNA repair protein RadC [candidate division KSB1 bacterium]|nr:DNA repair protein RadC [candidate division KSB1 bacterium]MDZ7346965.1 DNA repair protein RadC [candidate division KSB1 bacterium]MDZ7369911.1 DNA repair protein RadC [candidate division KSB1 bacterium]